jgi:hypothetical protein
MKDILRNACENLRNLRTDLLFSAELEDLDEENQEILLQAISHLAIARSSLTIVEIRTRESVK